MFSKIKDLFQRKKRADTTLEYDEEVDVDLEVAIAQKAIASGERDHALLHLTRVLYVSPNDEGALRLLNQLIDTAADPADFLPGVKPDTRAEAQMISYLLARCGRYDEAVDILTDVVSEEPRTGAIQWLIAWLDDQASAGRIPIDTVSKFFRWVAASAQGLCESDEARVETVNRLPILVERMRSTQSVDSDFLSAAAIALRRTGHLEEATATAQEAYAIEPGYFSAIATGNCLRNAGNINGAIRLFEEALKYDPDDVAAPLDIADMSLDRLDMGTAIRWYEEALKKEPDNDWALPSLYASRYLATGDRQWREALANFDGTHPGGRRAHEMWRLIRPYFGTWLPEPVDVTINLIRDRVAKDDVGNGVTVNCNISLIEAPSALLVVNRELESMARDVKFTLSVREIQTPDPRLPHGDVACLLWKYDGTTARPNIDAPSPAVARLVAEIASMTYDFDQWRKLAASTARSVGVNRAREVLSVMLHPADSEGKIEPWNWLIRNQIAAALVIAALPGEWQNSMRRQMLLDIVNGPLDWTVGAAAIGLVAAASSDAQAAKEVRDALIGLIDRAPNGFVCYRLPVLAGLLELVNLTDEEQVRYMGMLVDERRDLA